MLQQIQMYWKKASKEILDRFQIPPISEPKFVEYEEIDNISFFGGRYDSDTRTFILSTNGNEIPLKGVIYRECLRNSMPSILCDEARRDASIEFAHQNLSREERIHWVKHWKGIPGVRLQENLLYTSYKQIEWMVSLGGKSILDTLIHELMSMSKYGMGLSFEEFVEFVTVRTREIRVKFDNTDFRIMKLLSDKPNLTYSELADELGYSTAWISKRVKKLKNRYILMEFTSTPFSRIGIRNFYILIGGPPTIEPMQYFNNSPFLFSLQPILNEPWRVLGRLAVPDNPESVDSLKEMSMILQERGITVDIAETHSAAQLVSYYHYSVPNSNWNIPWIAMLGWGKRIEEESLQKVTPRIDRPANRTKITLDESDMQILSLVNEGISNVRTLRAKLSIGLNQLTRRLKVLRKEGLIRHTWSVRNTGLIERVAIRCTDLRTSEIIDTWCRELPKAHLNYGKDRTLLTIIELPAGGSSKMLRTLNNLRWSISVSLLGGNITGQWTFPSHLWDVSQQEWKPPSARIEQWLDSIANIQSCG